MGSSEHADTDTRKRLRRAHRLIRGQHREERTEDYVESIYRRSRKNEATRIVDLQKVFAVSHVTVIRALDKLEGAGFLRRTTKGITLTAKGKRLGEECYERHETVESFLLSLGVPKEIAESDAEGIEHHLSPQTLEAIRNHLGSR
ncbi:MAG: iron dependent repressor, metal binding and dimerization domain protein [Verrucomicrobiota bacterium]